MQPTAQAPEDSFKPYAPHECELYETYHKWDGEKLISEPFAWHKSFFSTKFNSRLNLHGKKPPRVGIFEISPSYNGTKGDLDSKTLMNITANSDYEVHYHSEDPTTKCGKV